MAAVARNLLILAAVAWLFCLFTVVIPIVPLGGFEATTVYVGLAYLFGASLAVIACLLTLISLFRYGRTRARVKMCICSVGMVLAFAALTVASIVIGSMAGDA